MSTHSLTNDDRFHDLIADYMRRIDAGEHVDREAFIHEHAEFSEPLRDYFNGVDVVEAMAGPLIATMVQNPQDPPAEKDVDFSHATVLKSQDTTGGSVAAVKTPAQGIPESFGRYKILKELGQGAMGAVYLAHDTQLDRKVALKIPKFTGAEAPEMLERFYREARSAATLRHPNICPVHDVGQIDGQHYITMAFIEGRPLKDFSRAKKLQPERQVAVIIRKLALGLAQAHAAGVIHRDLKPANVMVDGAGEPVVMDFGLARRSTAEDVQVTQSGAILGTPAYMSPEQVEGDQKKTGPAADIYSLGVILYELLAGKLPFQGGLLSILKQIAADDPAPPSQFRPGVDPVLEAICLKMMSKRTDDRYASMKEVAQALGEYLKSGAKPPAAAATSSTVSRLAPDASAKIGGSRSLPKPSGVKPAAIVAAKPTAQEASDHSLIGTLQQRFSDVPTKKWMVAALALFAAVVIIFNAITIYLRLGTIELKIVVDDPSIAIRVEGQTVTIENSGTPIRLTPGDHKFIIERDGLEVQTDSFTVKKEGKNVLSASIVDGQLTVLKNGEPSQPVVASKEREPAAPVKAGWHGWPADAPPPAIAPFDAEQAKKHQEAWAAYLKVPVEYTNSIGMKFRLIPPSEFMMGSTPEEIDELASLLPENVRYQEQVKSGGPQHKVILTKPIYLSIHEVTQKSYEAVMGSNPSHFASTGQAKAAMAKIDTQYHPVESVSWNSAVEFCAKLSVSEKLLPFKYGLQAGETVVIEGTGYRLPTEAEWEFACRAGTTTKYWIGDKDDSLALVGWIDRNSGGRTHPVGGLRANPLELFDTHGNVWEWVEDGWDPNYYGQFLPGPAVAPIASIAATSQRVVKGGGWSYRPMDCIASRRQAEHPGHVGHLLGFRVALAVDVTRNRPRTAVARVWQPTPEFQQWMDGVAKLTAEQQVEAVVKKLQELNSGYDGSVVQKGISAGTVLSLVIHTDKLTDVSPIASLASLKRLDIEHTGGKGKLVDLSPLRDLALTTFRCGGNPSLSDLSPLRGMKLIDLNCEGAKVSDLSPLGEMALESLCCWHTGVSDLAPLRGMPIRTLLLDVTSVTDISPLEGMPLADLRMARVPVADLTPLKGAPLQSLIVSDTKVTDLAPLKGMPLKHLNCEATTVSDLSPLRGMQLAALNIDRTKVDSLSHLQGMPLEGLSLTGTTIADLSPLAECPIWDLRISGTRVTDLSPLKSMPLKSLTCDFVASRDAEILRSIKTLETINGKPAAEFWKEAGTPPAAAGDGKR